MKDNFNLFEEVARMLEVPFFEEKLEQLKQQQMEKVGSG